MRERKGAKQKISQEYPRVITEILATRGRDAEHFVKLFRHESDHITGASLGVLLGIFEIDDHSEDSKYIVNFLFSVAKNEYFCNPRRGATESFEAALHKVNVALAEIVKHGNIGWLGKFHGTIAILEKNAIHLSATGDGRIYLFRNETLSHISEGLASPDASEHPIKTFVEISSGRLNPGDRLLFTLPKLFTLIDEKALERQAKRLEGERFLQFLRTALVNELDQSGALIVDIEEPSLSPPPSRQETPKQKPPVQSYFSETAFDTKRKESIATALIETPPQSSTPQKPEYIDTKTGHIYIQGEQHTMSVEPSRFAEYLEEFFHSSKTLRTQTRNTARRYTERLSDRTHLYWSVSLKRLRHLGATFMQRHQASKKKALYTPKTSSPASTSQALTSNNPTHFTAPLPRIKASFSALSQLSRPSTSKFSFLKKKMAGEFFVHIQNIRRFSGPAFSWMSKKFSNVLQSRLLQTRMLWSRLPKKIRVTLLGVGALLFLSGGWFWFQDTHSAPITPEVTQTPALIPPPALRTTEPGNEDLPPITTLFHASDILASTYLNNTPLIVTPITIEIPSLNISAALPVGSGTPRLITPMHDLRTLFILTKTGKLLAFTPSNRSFTENILPSSVSETSSLNAYLTYLYTLDPKNGQIIRFPRTTGGFSPGTSWLKESITLDTNTSFTVSDTVTLFTQGTVRQFLQGKEVRVFEIPKTPPTQLLLTSERGNPLTIGLDRQNQRLIIWDTEGKIIHQYFGDIPTDTTSVSLSAQSVLISSPTKTIVLSLP